MLNTWQDVVLVILIVAVSLFFMLVLNRLWPPARRKPHNDLIGWQLNILGTTYAVIMGFMLYTVWTNFGLADVNADSEASSLVNVYRLAEGLPEEQRNELRQTTRAYADVIVEKDWPAMTNDQTMSVESEQLKQRMWHILMSVKAASPEQLTAEDHALYELSTMAEHRRLRQLQNISRLPTVLWFVLIVGGAVTIMSTCMFSAESVSLHILQVVAFSFLVALVLAAIADIDRPFQGSVHVSDHAFRQAQVNMKDQ
jgi:hypothetical protein